MSQILGLLVVVHVVANLVWIGSILAVAWILPGSTGTSAERGRLGLSVYRQLAVPAMVSSLVVGLLRLFSNLDLYFVVTKYMHGKLLFALVILALHHVIGARAKAMAAGKRNVAGNAKLLGAALLVCAAATTFFAVLKPF